MTRNMTLWTSDGTGKQTVVSLQSEKSTLLTSMVCQIHDNKTIITAISATGINTVFNSALMGHC